MLATVLSAALQGIEAVPVQVEVNTGDSGDPKLVLVGLPDAAVKESQDRVSAALANSGRMRPHTRTTINLAPGDLRKEGPMYDLPIAIAILVALGQIRAPDIADFLIAGELSLSGETRPIRGGLAIGILAKRLGKKGVLLPPSSAEEAALVEGVSVYKVRSLDEAARFVSGELALPPVGTRLQRATPSSRHLSDFSEVKGQHAVRRAVEIAVAGGHNVLLIGPPGSGKSMIARRIPTIMPEPSLEEFLEVLAIHSAAGRTLHNGLAPFERPFRAPHHTVSDVALIGGGAMPGPGEISLAHQGLLFLDELPEFKRSALEVMRQPLEDGFVSISRSAGKITLPASFMLVAAMNPCPCGHLGDKSRSCQCSPQSIQRYRARISGPLLDRIDLHVEAPAVSISDLRGGNPGETSAVIRARVEAARSLQRQRFGNCNARMSQSQVRKACEIDAALGAQLEAALQSLNLSARAYERVLKVARTIADLAGAERIAHNHLFEAIQYRSLDRSASKLAFGTH